MSEIPSQFNVNQTHVRSFANISSIRNENSFDDREDISHQRDSIPSRDPRHKPPNHNASNLPQNLENIKQAYYSKM